MDSPNVIDERPEVASAKKIAQMSREAGPGTTDAAAPLESRNATPSTARSNQTCRSGALFVTLSEFMDEVPEEPEWIVEGLVAGGCVTELVAKVKVGKTHFALDMTASVLAGRPFLGLTTTTVPVIYLTEEGRTSFRSVTARVGLQGNERLHLCFRAAARSFTWETISEQVIVYAGNVGAGLVICDHLAAWAPIEGDSENDSGAALASMRPLRDMADAGLSVFVCRHGRKSGGPLGDAGRGSSAFDGEVDVIAQLERTPGQGHENRRELTATGRLEGIPQKMIVELDGGHYVFKGSESAVEHQETRTAILDLLGDSPETALTLDEIVKHTHKSRPTVQRVLNGMEDAGEASRVKGAGEASAKAYGYWLTPPTP